MRAIVIDAPGGPEVLHLGEVADPVAGRGEVLLRVHATAVNRADLLQRQGFYDPPPGASAILGLDASGVIAALGPGVSGWQTGDRVCALLAGGGYAELVAVPSGQLMPLPEGVDMLTAAGIPEVFLTAHDNLFTRARLLSGESVLIHGGAGGVGTAAIQLARRHDCQVLATAGSAEKGQRCLDLGATAAINHREEDFVERALALTAGRGVDVILDVMGASYLGRNLETLAPDGRLVVIGLQGGTAAPIDLSILLRRRLALIATTLRGRPLEQKAEIAARAVSQVWPGFADGSVRVVVDRVLSLGEAAAAHRALEAGDNVGKILLRVVT